MRPEIHHFRLKFIPQENKHNHNLGFRIYKKTPFSPFLQSNLDYTDLYYPDFSIIRTFSGPNFFMNIY